jgi:hypothetical protein
MKVIKPKKRFRLAGRRENIGGFRREIPKDREHLGAVSLD